MNEMSCDGLKESLGSMMYSPPAPGEEVVISGISGRFPESKNVLDLQNNLFNKVDLITSNVTRWKIDHPEIPTHGGKVHDLTKFDARFFGVHFKQAHTLDPMCRTLLEHAYEAIIDAGMNPRQLRGTNTGVIIGSCICEAEKTWFYEKLQANGYGITGCSRAMLANRISYTLGLQGPSYSMDTACSSSLYAMDQAYRLIRSGQCDRVLVGGANLCLHPYVSLQFARLGVLSTDCRCKSFDARANGYVRSEAISVALLQKAKDANRIYATVVYTKTNCDGYKEQGITFPASEIQKKLLDEFYNDCKIPPTVLSWLEAHGTGTVVGDPEELNAINKVFCEGRDTPLRIGSVKSNIGHTEPASGLCSVAKVIIGMETGLIPPNMHFQKPPKGIECFEQERVQVITEPTPWEGGYVGINSFGFGGANAHVLLKSNPKRKINQGAPTDNLPRVVIASGRTEEAVDAFLSQVENMPVVDAEYVRLLHEIHSENIPGHLFRGYSIVPKSTENYVREIQEYPGIKRPVWFVFSGMGSQWAGMGEALMKFPVFAKAIEKCDAALNPHGVDIIDIITNKDKKTFDNILNSFVGIAAVQIGLVDLLTSVGIVPDNIIGHSVGELGCAYADGCFTAEQMVLSAYSRGLASIETEMIRGSMAAVGLGYEDVKDLCPDDIEVACHNGPDSCTISGPAESMKQFVAKLQANKIFAKEVPCSNIAYHSRYIAAAGPKLLAYLKKVIPDPKPRSEKWVSTSVPRSEWSSPAAQYSSAEYHTNNLLNSVLFAETSTVIPANAITIEIAPHGLLQAILRRSLESGVTNIALTQRGHRDNSEFFLQALGRLYNAGLQPQFPNMYPKIEFPVSCGTPMISPQIKWEHSDDWYVPTYSQQQKITTGHRIVDVALDDETYEFMAHHVIDGRNLIPATGYLIFVWETFSMMKAKVYNEMSIVFENIKFERATTIPKEGGVQLTVVIHKGSGRFEIVEGNTAVVSGMVRVATNPEQEKVAPQFLKPNDSEECLTTKDIYKELKLRGYEYAGLFRSLKSASIDGTKGHIAWMKNWSAFMDNMLQLKLLGQDTRGLFVPTGILKMVIDTKIHNEMIRSMPDDNHEFAAFVYPEYDAIVAGGVEIRGLKANAIFRRKQLATPILEEYKFVAHRDKAEVTPEEMIVLSTHLAIENAMTVSPKIVELVKDEDDLTVEQLLAPTFLKVLGDLPMIQPAMVLATKAERYDPETLPNVNMIEQHAIPEDSSFYMAVAYDVLSKKRWPCFEQLLLAVKEAGFLLLLETSVDEDAFSHLEQCELSVVLEKTCDNKTFLLLRKREKPATRTEIVPINNVEFSWVGKIQTVLKYMEEKDSKEIVKLILVAEGDVENGALGFVKCLRREPYGEIVKTVIVQDEKAPKFSLENPLYTKQLAADIDINVLRPGGVWGTYRHLPLPPFTHQPYFHGFVTQMARGDLNSLQWIQGPIQPDTDKSKITRIAYSSLNFRDVMLATGKLAAETISKNREDQDCLIGFEYSGINAEGRKVMGLTRSRALSNLCIPTKFLEFYVPDGWTLEQAATVPSAYITAYYAFFYHGHLQKGEKVLIHAGSGAVGQAAIHLALYEGCEVFTTVGTPEKRKFIKETFPSIDDDHIGNSRDTTFEQLVMKQTKGQGVDIVLNSLAEDKLQASVRCLGFRGRFLEIGKFDLANNNQLGMEIFLKEVSFHGIMMDTLIAGWWPAVQEKLYVDINRVINSDAVKPLVSTVFQKDEVQAAFRYMAAGKHIGKVLIKIRDDNTPMDAPILCYPHFHSIPNKSYVIIGGLGGLGLEMTDWLVLRGARNLVMVSRNGIKDGYQKMRTERWKSYGVKVLIISGVDASKPEDCEFILKSAEKQAPVDGIFNLAAVLNDSLYVNQTEKTFEDILKPKVGITKTLDVVSRKICRQLRHFVVFSSISCGRGSAGQTNYGMANAVMERICERRRKEGLPGLAIEWGAVGEVGLAAELMENNKQLVIGGTLQQRISSCLEELNRFLTQDRPIVGSMVVAEKRAGSDGAANILEAVLNIMSMKDLKGVSHSASLAELGMDSMMAVEIKQTLERDFEVFLTPQDIRNLNVAKIIEMSAKDSKKNTSKSKKQAAEVNQLVGIKLWLRFPKPEAVNAQTVHEFPFEGSRKNEIFLIPGIEGSADIFSNLAKKLTIPATCLQFGAKQSACTVEDLANSILPFILNRSQNRRDFTIVAYSFGSLVAVNVVRQLEAHNLTGRFILLDGAPEYMQALKQQHIPSVSDSELENAMLIDILDVANSGSLAKFSMELEKCSTWEEKLEKVVAYAPPEIAKMYSADDQKLMCTAMYNRIKSIDTFDYSLPPIVTPIVLAKPTLQAVRFTETDYCLRKITKGKVDVYEVEGDHATIVDNDRVAQLLNGDDSVDDETFKATIAKLGTEMAEAPESVTFTSLV